MQLDQRQPRWLAAPRQRPSGSVLVRLTPPPAALVLLVGAALCALAGCAQVSSPLARVQALLQDGDLTRAYWVLQEAVEENPEDPELRRQLLELRVAYHLRQGQEKVFADDDWGGVQEFERVLLADPQNIAAKQWKEKALRKLADRAVAAGDDARARGKLEEAIKHYHEAEAYVPGLLDAERGSRLVSEVFAARREKGQENYVRGMRAQAGGLFHQTQYHMQIALDNDPSLAAAEERHRAARRHLAEERLRQAKLAEERGLYETAYREYKLAFAEFPDLTPDLESKVAAMQREVEAATKLNEGTLLVKRGEFERARELLEQAYEISLVQRVAISAQLVALREADLDRRYSAALDLELDYRYEDALVAYREIESNWPGQLDVRTRLQNLESSLELAREARARGEAAEAAGDLQGAISAYREALTYVPKFGDLADRVEGLKVKVKQADGSASPAEGGSKPSGEAQDDT